MMPEVSNNFTLLKNEALKDKIILTFTFKSVLLSLELKEIQFFTPLLKQTRKQLAVTS